MEPAAEAPPASNPHLEEKSSAPPVTVEPTCPPLHIAADQPQSYPPQLQGYPQQAAAYTLQQHPGAAVADPSQAYPMQQPPAVLYADSPQQQYPPPAPYYSQQQGYPPQQQGYPPQQQQGYPPQQQQGYPPQQQQAAGAPPSYYSAQVQVQQQQQTNVVVVAQPAARVTATTVNQPSTTVKSALVFATFITVLFTMCFCWFTLFCLIPAIIFGQNARSAAHDGDEASAKRKAYISYGLSAGAILTVFIGGWVCYGAVYGSIVIG